MDKPKKETFGLPTILKCWNPWRYKTVNISKDFWMPDDSCGVCYDCDAQFTVFNRKHHCRLCGRIFCRKCTKKYVPVRCADPSSSFDNHSEKVRVCNYCFKQWEQGLVHVGQVSQHDDADHSPSTASDASSKSSESSAYSSTDNTVCSLSLGTSEQSSEGHSLSPYQSAMTDPSLDIQGIEGSGKSNLTVPLVDDSCVEVEHCESGKNRSDGDILGFSNMDWQARENSRANEYYTSFEINATPNAFESEDYASDNDDTNIKGLSSYSLQDYYNMQDKSEVQEVKMKEDIGYGTENEVPLSLSFVEDVNIEPVDFENSGLLWLPPEPEIEDDDKDVGLVDNGDDNDDDDGGGDGGGGGDTDAMGEWSQLHTHDSFGSDEYHAKEKPVEEQKKAIKSIVDGHFRALLSQLLQVDNIPISDNIVNESWLEIITALSWEVATLLKPDTSKDGVMDPGGYVKVKCIASGRRSESTVVKGVVCRKNVAHRRMKTKIKKPRLMILGGALEYQRVSNVLLSFDTLLQQERDHLKMAIAKIDAHRPNVLLVEKSVSRYAQEYILAKDISLILNIKRPLLERIARCTGAQIVPSVDHLSTQNIGYCDLFHLEKFFEDHGSVGQAGKHLTKTLMYFEGCPKPLGFTILLRGANVDELKKVKHVVQYGVFAAYHLALETSFLADEGASLSVNLIDESLTAALPKNIAIDRSISVVPGFSIPLSRIDEDFHPMSTSTECTIKNNEELTKSLSLPTHSILKDVGPSLSSTNFTSSPIGSIFDSVQCHDEAGTIPTVDEDGSTVGFGDLLNAHLKEDCSDSPQFIEPTSVIEDGYNTNKKTVYDEFSSLKSNFDQQDGKTIIQDEFGTLEEVFPPSPSDNQSILVSLSSRCVWKGTVCERSHIFRIKYYGNFDKPLGRFLQDHLFDQGYRCRSCDMPSDAHVHCYTHRQGTLTISVKKLPEILLPGENEGRIWMWHRCLRCPRTHGYPPATRRVVMSDAAWGLSFGKFLELSFSNHAAASRVAICGHSLHRDCLRFYGCGKMVSCFRYASIDIFSIYLPPAKVDFTFEIQEWIQKEATEVVEYAELLFCEVHNAIKRIVKKKYGEVCIGTLSFDLRLAALEELLQNEKAKFKDICQRLFNTEARTGHHAQDILEINRLRKHLLLESYLWDQRLDDAAKGENQEEDKVLPNGELMDSRIHIRSYQILTSSPDHTYDFEDQGDPSVFIEKSEQRDPLLCGSTVRRVKSDSQYMNMLDTLDASRTNKSHSASESIKDNNFRITTSVSTESSLADLAKRLAVEHQVEEKFVANANVYSTLVASTSPKGPNSADDPLSRLRMPFLNFYRSFNRRFLRSEQNLDKLAGYHSAYISLSRELESGAKWFLPEGPNETTIPIYDDELTSIISYALTSLEYHFQLYDAREKSKYIESASSLPLQDSANFRQFSSSIDPLTESDRSLSIDESFLSTLGPRNHSFVADPLLCTKSLHVRVSFTASGSTDKRKYSVTCYYAKHFDALRKLCCPSELDYIRSLSRCKKWGAQGGKSNVFFAKTLDDRFIIKQVKKTELESFIKFAPEYFKYLMEAINAKSPTCLAKVLGIYQVTSKNLKGGKESKMDVLVMENLLFRRNVTRVYDLKGSSRSRYNPDTSGSNKVLLDQNLIEEMSTSPIFISNKAKRLLARAVWNDTSFLAGVDVMDYSLLVGVDKEKHELVIGIIDFMRRYTWDKHLETWVKASGIFGGPKNVSPTVISPEQYKKRFRQAMSTYFVMVPDNWSSPTTISSQSQHNMCEENEQGENHEVIKDYS